MRDDPWARLARARRTYAMALAERRQAPPGSPGYRDAVHRLGVAWTQVIHWERKVIEERKRRDREQG